MTPALTELLDGTAWLRRGLQQVDLDTGTLSGPEVWQAAAKAAAQNVLPATTLPRPMRVCLLTLWCASLSEAERTRLTTDPFPRAVLAVRFGLTPADVAPALARR